MNLSEIHSLHTVVFTFLIRSLASHGKNLSCMIMKLSCLSVVLMSQVLVWENHLVSLFLSTMRLSDKSWLSLITGCICRYTSWKHFRWNFVNQVWTVMYTLTVYKDSSCVCCHGVYVIVSYNVMSNLIHCNDSTDHGCGGFSWV